MMIVDNYWMQSRKSTRDYFKRVQTFIDYVSIHIHIKDKKSGPCVKYCNRNKLDLSDMHYMYLYYYLHEERRMMTVVVSLMVEKIDIEEDEEYRWLNRRHSSRS